MSPTPHGPIVTRTQLAFIVWGTVLAIEIAVSAWLLALLLWADR